METTVGSVTSGRKRGAGTSHTRSGGMVPTRASLPSCLPLLSGNSVSASGNQPAPRLTAETPGQLWQLAGAAPSSSKQCTLAPIQRLVQAIPQRLPRLPTAQTEPCRKQQAGSPREKAASHRTHRESKIPTEARGDFELEVNTPEHKTNQVPGTDSESQPRVPHHLACGFDFVHAVRLRVISAPQLRPGHCTRRFRSDAGRASVRSRPKPTPERPHASHRDDSRFHLAVWRFRWIDRPPRG